MPARLDHLPNHYERSILQKLRERGGAGQIADAGGRTTIRKLLEKGWIEHGSSSILPHHTAWIRGTRGKNASR